MSCLNNRTDILKFFFLRCSFDVSFSRLYRCLIANESEGKRKVFFSIIYPQILLFTHVKTNKRECRSAKVINDRIVSLSLIHDVNQIESLSRYLSKFDSRMICVNLLVKCNLSFEIITHTEKPPKRRRNTIENIDIIMRRIRGNEGEIMIMHALSFYPQENHNVEKIESFYQCMNCFVFPFRNYSNQYMKRWRELLSRTIIESCCPWLEKPPQSYLETIVCLDQNIC